MDWFLKNIDKIFEVIILAGFVGYVLIHTVKGLINEIKSK